MTRELSASEYLAGMEDYARAGTERARALGNRGPLRLGRDGRLAGEILDRYHEHGFYVFEDLIQPDELAELRSDFRRLVETAVPGPASSQDPATSRDLFTWVEPLSDPWGGTEVVGGRYQVKMTEPAPETKVPDLVPLMMYRMFEFMDSALRLYGHPKLLAVAESINGPDFTPFKESIFIKQPGVGGAVSWHQDGLTHWSSPAWEEDIHGFNFQLQLYPCSALNSLWVVPGTHKLGRVDIRKRVAENGGSDRLPDAVPLVCNAGDVTIVNRQELHGSFPNASGEERVSLTFGFHKRSSVLGARILYTGEEIVYDEDRIFERSSLIQTAIDARHQRFPDEEPYRYQPFVGLESQYRFDEAARERIRDYDLKDLGI